MGLDKTCIGAEIRCRLAIKSPLAGDSLVVSMSRLTAANCAADRARGKMLHSAGPGRF